MLSRLAKQTNARAVLRSAGSIAQVRVLLAPAGGPLAHWSLTSWSRVGPGEGGLGAKMKGLRAWSVPLALPERAAFRTPKFF